MPALNIIEKKSLEGANRIDAEYYQPIYFEIEGTLEKIGYKTLGDSKSKIVSFGAYSLCNYIEFVDDGVPYLNVKNIKENYIDKTDLKFITSSIHKILKKSKISEGQVLLTMSGTVGVSAVAHDLPIETNANQAIAKITPSDEFLPFFLSTFLNSKYGKLQTKRLIISNVQPNLLLTQIKRIKIPLFDKTFQYEVEKLVKQGLDLLKQADEKREEADRMLTKVIGKIEFKNKLTYETNLSYCINKHRVDAEYYQPKYDEIFERIHKIAQRYSWKEKTIGEISEPLRYGTSEKLTYVNEGIPFLRITDIQNFDFAPTSLTYISEEESKNVKYASVKENDVLISRSGTLGLSVAISKPLSNSIFGSYFIRVRPKIEIDSNYLAFYLNSFLGNTQVEQLSTGTIQTNLTIPAIDSIRILIPDKEFQKSIRDLLYESKILRQNGKNLLKSAIIKVEHKIEEKIQVNSS